MHSFSACHYLVMTIPQAAETLNVSELKNKSDYGFAKVWLKVELA